MIPKKFLIGGTATVGSVVTVAAAANQFGTTASSETPETVAQENLEKNPDAAKQQVPPEEPKPTTVVPKSSGGLTSSISSESNKTLLRNWKSVNGWEIQIIQENDSSKSFEDNSISDEYLAGLPGYLDAIESISLDKKIPFIFKKLTGNKWGILIKEQLNAWAKNALNGESIREIKGFPEHLSPEELKQLLDYLKGKENLFKSADGKNGKTIFFEEDGDDWKHAKTEIENWLKSIENKFSIKIEDNKKEETLDEINEENLAYLLIYLKDKKSTLLQLIKNSNPTHLTFKKTGNEDSSWEVMHSQTTIENWVDNTSKGKASLKLWKDYSEQKLSELKKENGELEKIFEALIKKEDLFKESNLSGATENNKKIIVFEKHEYFVENDLQWMHIKEAIKKWVEETWGNESKMNKIKIEKKDKSKTLIKEMDDDELTGLLEHLCDKSDDSGSDDTEDEEDYQTIINSEDRFLILKRDDDNQWEQVEDKPSQ